MVSTHIVRRHLLKLYEVEEWRNACAVLSVAYPDEWDDLLSVLAQIRLLRTDIVRVVDEWEAAQKAA